MPRIDKMYTLEVGVEQFLNACSPLELKEVEMLILSPRFQNKMDGQEVKPVRPEFPEYRCLGGTSPRAEFEMPPSPKLPPRHPDYFGDDHMG